jgi:hypothetical protein
MSQFNLILFPQLVCLPKFALETIRKCLPCHCDGLSTNQVWQIDLTRDVDGPHLSNFCLCSICESWERNNNSRDLISEQISVIACHIMNSRWGADNWPILLPADRTHDDRRLLSVPVVGTNGVDMNSTAVSGSQCRITWHQFTASVDLRVLLSRVPETIDVHV